MDLLKLHECVLTISHDAYGFPNYETEGSLVDAVLSMTFTPFLYRGYMYDHDVGLYYLQSRFYNPLYGRFLNADETDMLTESTDKPIGINLFAYCNNNPVMYIDESGHIAVLALIIGIIACVLIVKFFCDLFNTKDQLIELLRVHTENVLQVGLYNNTNVNLQVYEYFDADDNSNIDYIDTCRDAFQKMVEWGILDAAGMTNSYNDESVETLRSSMLTWDPSTFWNILNIYTQKYIFSGFVELFTF